jgi:hypothetical protein
MKNGRLKKSAVFLRYPDAGRGETCQQKRSAEYND